MFLYSVWILLGSASLLLIKVKTTQRGTYVLLDIEDCLMIISEIYWILVVVEVVFASIHCSTVRTAAQRGV